MPWLVAKIDNDVLLNMEPLYVVEEPGEWRMEVYDDGVIFTVDYYESFAEIVFI
jgi:hypothetical protein